MRLVNTNYIGMRFGAYEVIGYNVNMEKEEIELELKCTSCGEYRVSRLKYETILKIKCRRCGRLDVVVPVDYYDNTKLVKDTISVGAYRYRQIRKEFNKDNEGKSEVDYVRDIVYNNRKGRD